MREKEQLGEAARLCPPLTSNSHLVHGEPRDVNCTTELVPA